MEQVINIGKLFLGNDVTILPSTRKNKKFMVLNPENKYVHFGDNRYEDFTQHKDKDRQQKYLNRSSKIKGNWKDNKYSPNNLSINILWK
jgi:hypothetical protein